LIAIVGEIHGPTNSSSRNGDAQAMQLTRKGERIKGKKEAQKEIKTKKKGGR